MIGASLYNRQVQVEQLFVKQRNNQFTLSGESALPQKLADWFNPDFRGDISASINDLGDFARLFGASPSDFAGKIDIAGKRQRPGAKTRRPAFGLRQFARLVPSALRIAQRRAQPERIAPRDCNSSNFAARTTLFAARRAWIWPASEPTQSAFTNSIAEIADYTESASREPLQSLKLSGSLELDWTGNGTDDGAFGHVPRARNRPASAGIIRSSPSMRNSKANIRRTKFSSGNSISRIRTPPSVPSSRSRKIIFKLQTLRLDLNGKPTAAGQCFSPAISLRNCAPRAIGWRR